MDLLWLVTSVIRSVFSVSLPVLLQGQTYLERNHTRPSGPVFVYLSLSCIVYLIHDTSLYFVPLSSFSYPVPTGFQ